MTNTDEAAQPNVLLVQTDQQRWDTLGTYGNPMGLTPTLDDLARNGTKIQYAFTPQPLCGTSRSALQTGQYATRHGIYTDVTPLPTDVRTLAHELRAVGYDAGFVGDWQLAGTFDDPVPPDSRGGYEDYWIAADVPEYTSQPEAGALYDGHGDRVEFSKYRADAFTDFALDGLERLTEPFLLVISFIEPHDQNERGTFVAPEGYAERHANDPYIPPDLHGRPGEWFGELPDYYGMVERIDECVGRLLDGLARHEYEDTVVCFTSDHGCHFRTRPGEYKRSPHESSIRVPLLFSGGVFDGGGVIEDLVSLIDVPATLLDVAGVGVPERMDGRSVLPLLDGDREEWPADVFVQTSEAEIGRAIRTRNWKYAVAAPTMDGWRGGMGEQESERYVERYLYDLASDPAERINLVGRADYRGVAEELRERLHERIVAAGEPVPDIHQFVDPGYREF